MSNWPVGDGGRYEDAGSDLTDSAGTTVNIGAGPSYGAYVELISSTSFEANWITVYANKMTVDDNQWYVSIAIGASTEEYDVIYDLLVDPDSEFEYGICKQFPVLILPDRDWETHQLQY